MYKGGKESYSEGAARIIRYVTAIAAIVLALYGSLIQSGFVAGSPFFSMEVLLVLAALWLLLGLDQLVRPTRTALTAKIRLVTFHVLASAYVVLISGFSMPLTVGWIILIVASSVYFGREGAKASIAWMMLTVAVNAILLANIHMPTAIADLMSLIGIVLTSVVIFGVYQAQHVRRRELARSRTTETLQRERILTLINNLADAVISTDAKGIIKIYNAASLNLLDTNQSLNGQHIDSVLRVVDEKGQRLNFSDELQALKTTRVRSDVQMPVGDDDRLRLEVTLSPIRGNFAASTDTRDGYVVILRDITRAKSLEEERDEFISVVSHELRTPITITEGSISNAKLMLEKGTASPHDVADSIDMAHEQVLFLARMVNDLSTLSRAERGVSDAPEQIDVKTLIHELYKKYSTEAARKQLHFDIDLGARVGHVFASRLYTEELLQNFITNAIKYTLEGSITLSAKQHSGIVTFTVKDTGIGMSKADQKKIFDKFYRVEDYRTRETNGTGIGLYVAAKLARKLGTHIELTSRLNHGSTFSFSLPASKREK